MTQFTNETQSTQITTETTYGSRTHLALRPTPAQSESQQDAAQDAFIEAYLADQKAQKAMSRGSRSYLDIDEAYNLGVGAKSTWHEPGKSTTVTVRSVDPTYKARLDQQLAQGLISEKAHGLAIRQALGEDIDAVSPPEADVVPLEFDAKTSQNARWTMAKVGDSTFNTALTSYAMGNTEAARGIAARLHEHGVTESDVTGLFNDMASQALVKIEQVKDANGDFDVDIRDVVDWARGLERSQTRELATTVLASAMFNNFQHVPELIQAYRVAKGIRR